jgi:hypothetical protein
MDAVDRASVTAIQGPTSLQYLFTQANPYPSVAVLPELVFGAW